MRLFEFEGKDLFKLVEIAVPDSLLVETLADFESREFSFPLVAKAQVLSGKRGKRGLVKVCTGLDHLGAFVQSTLGREIHGEQVNGILLEEAVDIAQELFVSITYSTKTRGPILLFSEAGGVEVESENSVEEIELQFGVDMPELYLPSIESKFAELGEKNVEQIKAKVWQTVQKLWQLFQEKDLFLAEINPLVITKDGHVIAVDAKVVTDEAAEFRQEFEFESRNILGRAKTPAEMNAALIDSEDHRGVVGRVYLELPGDIGVIAAGGGASLVAMDAMVSYGLKPANYTEFSGNPPKWKVSQLTEIVLSRKGLKGAILVGGKANFTDQVETLSGFVEGLIKINPQYPVVIRRDGPRMDEAKEILERAAEKHGWNLHVYDAQTSIMEAVQKLVDLVGN